MSMEKWRFQAGILLFTNLVLVSALESLKGVGEGGDSDVILQPKSQSN